MTGSEHTPPTESIRIRVSPPDESLFVAPDGIWQTVTGQTTPVPGLAIINPAGDKIWHITHIPSGCRLGPDYTKAQALAVVTALGKLAQWDFGDEAWDYDEWFDHIKNAMDVDAANKVLYQTFRPK